ncbi:MAG TPA: hypothetical protein VLC95_05180 [Anaerolineae bacterium]|nr:hypothetical protein [Anaerolineae bacterium]
MILRDIPVAVTPAQVLATGRGGRTNPALLRQAEEAIALGCDLWRPAAVYDWFDVRGVEGASVRLAGRDGGGDALLHLGPKADMMAGAGRALVAVGTIGPALEQRVSALQREGQAVLSYLLDSAGVLALGAAGEALRCLAEEAAAEAGWGVGAALAPGSLVGWPLEGQHELCRLLPLGEVGVHLTGYAVLEPHKSFSVLIGIGPGYDARHVGSVCKFCALQDTCWRRREDPA